MATGRGLDYSPQVERGNAGLAALPDEHLLGIFVAQGDERAFEAIVVRHGPRVLGVCRQVLRRPHDVEDIFQATFLLLARKAGTIRERGSLGHWLHGVAHRLAVRTKMKISRRVVFERERQGEPMPAAGSEGEVERGEVRRIVHEEIDRLPERFREPILLCYLEGLTNDAAARHLGCPSSTLKERLGRGREILHGRLAKRGLAVSVALLMMLLPGRVDAGDVPRRLLEATVMAAMATRTLAVGGMEGPASHASTDRLRWLLLAAGGAGTIVTAILYFSTAEREGFVAWFIGAVRRACH